MMTPEQQVVALAKQCGEVIPHDDPEAPWEIAFTEESIFNFAQQVREAHTAELTAKSETSLGRWGRADKLSPRLFDRREDGYWTSWHIATEAIAAMQAQLEEAKKQAQVNAGLLAIAAASEDLLRARVAELEQALKWSLKQIHIPQSYYPGHPNWVQYDKALAAMKKGVGV